MAVLSPVGTVPVAKLRLMTWLMGPVRDSAPFFKTETGIPSTPIAPVLLRPLMTLATPTALVYVKSNGSGLGGQS